MSDDNEIAEVRASEVDRGKKTPAKLQQKERRLKKVLQRALEKGDRKLFEQTLNDAGQPYDSEAHQKSMKLFDDYHAKK
jgi:hypothetical protein